jgi:hypothetical protein
MSFLLQVTKSISFVLSLSKDKWASTGSARTVVTYSEKKHSGVRHRSERARRIAARGLLYVVCAMAAFSGIAAEAPEDHRAWQHGVDLIRVGEKLLLVWGSPGNPPRANPGGDWQHDVYYAWLDPATASATTRIEPRVLVARPEAQEPPSVAINSRGTILMTSEDGEDGINQRAGLWDSRLNVLRAYPFEIRRGGHSGHVAALGERFLVTYGEGWVDGGGWRERGTGRDIYARFVGNDGLRGREVRIANGHRDGWPLVAASDRNALVVWQRYPGLTLHGALVDAAGVVAPPRQLADRMPLRYAYAVEYAARAGFYVVAGSSGVDGFVTLLNLRGEVISTRRGLPPLASESRIVLREDGATVVGVYPVRPRGFAVVHISAVGIELVRLIDHPHEWDYTGTTGVFVAPARLLFATLSTAGLRLIALDLTD